MWVSFYLRLIAKKRWISARGPTLFSERSNFILCLDLCFCAYFYLHKRFIIIIKELLQTAAASKFSAKIPLILTVTIVRIIRLINW